MVGGRLGNLGNNFRTRYERTGNLRDLGFALEANLAAWSNISTPILIRIRVALRAAKMLVLFGV